MNSLNRCPAKYRNLSPKQECRLRSVRLGYQETPGALPKIQDNSVALALAESRRSSIMDALRKGHDTRVKLRGVLHGATWIDVTLEALVAAKAIVGHRGKTSVRYEVQQ